MLSPVSVEKLSAFLLNHLPVENEMDQGRINTCVPCKFSTKLFQTLQNIFKTDEHCKYFFFQFVIHFQNYCFFEVGMYYSQPSLWSTVMSLSKTAVQQYLELWDKYLAGNVYVETSAKH